MTGGSSPDASAPATGLRILQVDKFLRRFGGAAAYMLDLGGQLQRRGHRVEYFAAWHPDNIASTYEAVLPHVEGYDPPPDRLGARVRAGAGMFWSRNAARAMSQVLDDFQPDVVHLHNIYHQLSPSILRPIARRGIPMVMTLHDFKLICPTYRLHDGNSSCEACLGGGFHNAVLRRCKSGSVANSAVLAAETALHRWLGAYDPVDVFVCPSRFLLDKLVEGGFDRRRLRHIPNFTSVELADAPPVADGAVLNVGRMSQEKGLDTLIEACALAPARPLRIAGEGGLEGQLRDLAGRVAPDTTTFLGHLDQARVRAEIDGARTVVFPARGYENMPLAIIETMARGVPVIVTDIGGSPELVADGGGLSVPPDDPVALRAAIDRLDDDETVRRLGQQGIDLVASRYTPDAHVAAIEDLYSGLIGTLMPTDKEGSVNAQQRQVAGT